MRRACCSRLTAAESARCKARLAHLGSGPDPVKAVGVKTGFFSEGYVLDPGSEAEAMLGRTHAQVFGRQLESFTTPGYLDGRVFALYADTPALVHGPVSESIHGFDERVSVESIRRITKSIALFIAGWCGIDERPVNTAQG